MVVSSSEISPSSPRLSTQPEEAATLLQREQLARPVAARENAHRAGDIPRGRFQPAFGQLFVAFNPLPETPGASAMVFSVSSADSPFLAHAAGIAGAVQP